MQNLFLPINKQDLKEKNWEYLDIILISGDAYVDHPSFGTALIGRVLESKGFRVGIIAQPDWKNNQDFMRLGKPRLFFGITSGNLDSMLAHYTANKKLRRDDAYSPRGKHGFRPNRATIVYANKIREIYKKDVPIVIGGIEASMRRFAHYDYWTNKVRKSILFDSKADVLVYGMAEKSIIEVAERINKGKDINGVRGICYITNTIPDQAMELPGFEDVSTNKRAFVDAQLGVEKEQCSYKGKILVQKCMNRFLVQNAPQPPLSQKELDSIYNLPYIREQHPIYNKIGSIPALNSVKFSITSHRGCYGSCSFCSIGLHQGKIIQSRSAASIINEAKGIAAMSDFKGHITDVGGPTANMYMSDCANWGKGICKSKKCISGNKICKNMTNAHNKYLKLLRDIKQIPNIKHVSISTGIRHDLIINDDNFIQEICKNFISGKLKLAPEHSAVNVLKLMNKPGFDVFCKFLEKYRKINKKLDKKQFIEPYFISSHPGCNLQDMNDLIKKMKKLGISPKQVQDFIPNPMTLSTCMYYTGLDSSSGEKIYVANTDKDKLRQRNLFR